MSAPDLDVIRRVLEGLDQEDCGEGYVDEGEPWSCDFCDGLAALASLESELAALRVELQAARDRAEIMTQNFEVQAQLYYEMEAALLAAREALREIVELEPSNLTSAFAYSEARDIARAVLGKAAHRAARLVHRLDELVAALREADGLLKRLSEWDVLNLALGSGDEGPYWQKEIALVRDVIARAVLVEGARKPKPQYREDGRGTWVVDYGAVEGERGQEPE